MTDNILLIDIGNTAIKWCFNGQYQSVLVDDFSLDLLPKADKVFASCVGDRSVLDSLDGVVFVKSKAQFNAIKSDAQLIGDVKTFEGLLLDVPEGVDVSAYNTVVIWCEAFGEFITAAKYR